MVRERNSTSAARTTFRHLDARGAITWVGLVLLLGAALAGYLAWAWAPVYWERFEAEQVVREIGNLAVRRSDDGALVAELTARLAGLGQLSTEGGDGRPQRPRIDVRPQDVTWERLAGPTLHVALEYRREVVYPWIEHSVERTMTIDLTMDTSAPRW